MNLLRSRASLFLAGLAFLSLLLAGSVLTFELYYAERFYPGLQVWHVDVGGKQVTDAGSILEERMSGAPPVTLRGPERSWAVPPTDLGVQMAADSTLAPAYEVGRDGGWGERVASHLELLMSEQVFPPVLTYDERVARIYLETLAESIDYPSTSATLSLDGLTPVINPAQPGRYLDVEATLVALFPAVARLEPATVDLVVREIPPSVAAAEPAKVQADALLNGPLTLVLTNPREGDPGPWTLAPQDLAQMLVVWDEGGELHAGIDEDALRAYVESLAPALAIEPIDARFEVDAWGQLQPIQPSVEGRKLDVGATVVRIVQELAADHRHIPLAVEPVPPRYPDTATAAGLGVTDLVAEGESYFIGSPSGRDHNIRLAATKFHGIVVPPGGTFSFNHHLGPVTEEAGYDKSYITAGEQLAIGIGGGICQVSTTAFRAAFWAGYPITERWYHHQRVGYYELRGGGVGMDATVYSPRVDLKFVNDRDYPLLIQTEIDDATHRLAFLFYSTDDGRRVEMDEPEVTDETEPGPPIYELDETLEPGTVTKWQSAVGGLTATVERRVYDAQGDLVRRDVFVSEYAPRRAAYHYGPGYEPPQESDTAGEAE